MPMMPPEHTLIPARVVDARADDRAVVLARGVEVVVVGVEARFGEPLRLPIGEHAEGAARLEAQRLHAAHHVEHAVELGAVTHLAPGRAHAETRRSRSARAASGFEHLAGVEHAFATHARLVVRRLRAIRAILGAAAGLDAEQRAQLHLAAVVQRRVNLARAIDEREQRPRVEHDGLVDRPVVADIGRHHGSFHASYQ
jgi:hypothetical protein